MTALSTVTPANGIPVAMPGLDVGLGDGAVNVLYEKLRSTIWDVTADDEPLAICACALILRLDPLISARRIAEALPEGDGRFGLLELVNLMAALGFRESRLRLRPSELDPRLSPALVLIENDGHSEYPHCPAVMWSRPSPNGTAAAVFDGRTGQSREMTPAENVRASIVIFRRIEEDRLDTSILRRKRSGYGWFRVVLGRFSSQINQIFALGVIINLLTLSVPLFIILVYERALSPAMSDSLSYLALGVVCVVGSEALLRRARSRLLIRLTARLDYVVGVAIFEQLMRLPASLIQKASASDQISRIKTFESIRDFFCGPILMMALEIPAAALSFGVLYLIGGSLVVVPAISSVLLVLTFLYVWRRVRIRIREAAMESSVMQQFTIETFEKMESIRLDGLSDRWSQKYREISGREVVAQLRLQRLGQIGETQAHLIVGLTALAALHAGTARIWEGQMGTGALIACVMLIWRCLGPLHAFCGMIPRFEQMRNSIQQIDKLMEVEEERGATEGETSCAKLAGRIAFVGVAHRYEGTAPLFTGLSFEVKLGEIVAVTGPNGTGKSTILKLILGVEQCLLGSVRLDGFDVRQLDPQNLRHEVSYVPQQIDLFPGTIAANLRAVMPTAERASLRTALELVGAWPTVAARQGGLDAVLTMEDFEDPVFRYQIGLARAMLKPSRVLLIDEMPTTALLAGLDENLRACLRAASRDRATIMVTYRNDFLREADRIVALRSGRTPIVGSPDKIMRLD